MSFGDPAAAERAGPRGERLVLDLEGFEGPLDVLLDLARDQKVDLTRISILQLADQYLAFIASATDLRLELAADYLVMAAWLAYLKSRLLLPQSGSDEEPSGPEMAAALRFQLRRLEALRAAIVRLMARPRLGQDVFPRGETEEIGLFPTPVYDVSLYDLLKAYADHKRRTGRHTLRIEPMQLYSVEDALRRLTAWLGSTPDWRTLSSFLPTRLKEGMDPRSVLAATLAASLELARSGKIALRQDAPFGPIFIRGKSSER